MLPQAPLTRIDSDSGFQLLTSVGKMLSWKALIKVHDYYVEFWHIGYSWVLQLILYAHVTLP